MYVYIDFARAEGISVFFFLIKNPAEDHYCVPRVFLSLSLSLVFPRWLSG